MAADPAQNPTQNPVLGFSVLTLLCAFAPDPWTFGALRFLAGLGLGGVLPVAITLVNEYARVGKGGGATTVLGAHAGAAARAGGGRRGGLKLRTLY
jgi:AAHS family benzoate transporter-like MFS transporter